MKQQTYPDYKKWIPEWMRIDTARGKFIGRAESMVMDLAGSKLLVGTK